MYQDYTQASANPPKQSRLNIAILTTMWRRQVLTEFTFKWFAEVQKTLLKHDIGLYLFAVGSEGEYSRTLALENNYNYMERVNFPVSLKRNQALEKIRDWDIDCVLFVDTDDLLPVEQILLYVRFLEQGYPYIGIRDIYFFEGASKKMIHFFYPQGHSNFGTTLGLGRCVSRELLDKVNWRLWSDDLNRNMDINMTKTISSHLSDFSKGEKKVFCKDFNLVPVDIKTKTNIWSFDKYTNRLGSHYDIADPKKVLNQAYGKRVADNLYTLNLDTQLLPKWNG